MVVWDKTFDVVPFWGVYFDSPGLVGWEIAAWALVELGPLVQHVDVNPHIAGCRHVWSLMQVWSNYNFHILPIVIIIFKTSPKIGLPSKFQPPQRLKRASNSESSQYKNDSNQIRFQTKFWRTFRPISNDPYFTFCLTSLLLIPTLIWAKSLTNSTLN